MYTFESRVRYSEVDGHQKLTLASIINYLQDCTTFHSRDLGLGVEDMEERGKVWILSAWQVVVERYPKMGEYIQVSTWATGFNGLYGTRNFQILDKQQRSIVQANSIWVFMDIKKGRPEKPEPQDVKAYGEEPALQMEYAPRKIQAGKNQERKETFPVRKYHIDTNGHVNNCQYVRMAQEAIGDERHYQQVRVEYRKSAVWGNYIIPHVAIEEGRTVVELCDGDQKPYAVVEFKGEII